jgi:hypothetical protein
MYKERGLHGPIDMALGPQAERVEGGLRIHTLHPLPLSYRYQPRRIQSIRSLFALFLFTTDSPFPRTFFCLSQQNGFLCAASGSLSLAQGGRTLTGQTGRHALSGQLIQGSLAWKIAQRRLHASHCRTNGAPPLGHDTMCPDKMHANKLSPAARDQRVRSLAPLLSRYASPPTLTGP